MTNKIVKVPVADINGLQSDGSYLFRYRVKSKDNSRKSEWSEPQKLTFPFNWYGDTSSMYELYIAGDGYRPNIASSGGNDPHPSTAYQVSDVSAGVSATYYIKSSISYAQDDTQMYTYSWSLPSKALGIVNQSFDVYLSWKYTSTGWSDWKYSGTTTGNSFSFNKPASTAQYVQAVVFFSSNPKFTNIYGQGAEITFLSMSDVFSTYQDVGNSTLSIVTPPGATGGKYTANITSLAEPFPISTAEPFPIKVIGRKIFTDTATFDEKDIVVKERVSASQIRVESSVIFGSPTVTTTLSNVRL